MKSGLLGGNAPNSTAPVDTDGDEPMPKVGNPKKKTTSAIPVKMMASGINPNGGKVVGIPKTSVS